MKVNFLIAGTQKGGTSALHHHLLKHPNLCFATRKETHFFDNELLFRLRRNRDALYARFHSMYAQGPECALYGDATPIYLYWKPAAKRILEYNPDMKFIFVLRNPVERAFSHYSMEVGRGADRAPFSTAIRLERLRCLVSFPFQSRVYSYVDRGYYARQIRRLLGYFPMENMLFIKSEDLLERHDETLDRVCGFLGVPPFHVEKELVFETDYRSTMTPEQRRYLIEKYEESIRNLEELLGWDCSRWLKAD